VAARCLAVRRGRPRWMTLITATWRDTGVGWTFCWPVAQMSRRGTVGGERTGRAATGFRKGRRRRGPAAPRVAGRGAPVRLSDGAERWQRQSSRERRREMADHVRCRRPGCDQGDPDAGLAGDEVAGHEDAVVCCASRVQGTIAGAVRR
jgi:hypothetical protein